VLTTVEFQDEVGLGAQEIDDIGPSRDLAFPLPAAELAVSQSLPDAGFNRGLFVA
jgi:hypothetical protein